jgi:ABC-2 type transport system permease protein
VRTALAITVVELKRFLKDRSNIFFVFVFPLLLVLFIGAQFGGQGGGRVTLSGEPGALHDDLVAALEDGGARVSVLPVAEGRELVARGRADVAVVVPSDAARAYETGGDVTVELVLGNQAQSEATAQRVQGALDALALSRGQAAALEAAGLDAVEATRALEAADAVVQPTGLEVTNVSEIAQEFAGLGQFDYGAASQVLLFVFLISLAGSTTLIQSRRLGVTRRTLAAPVTTGQTVLGQAMGRLAIAATQGAYIMAATTLLFDVDWGNLPLAFCVVVVFGLVAAGAAMLLGSVVDNDAAAGGVGVGVALVLGALGGVMYPIELFPDTLRRVAQVTPHAWAGEAMAQVQRHGAGLTEILPQLGVLLGYAAVLLLLGAWLLRRSLARAI